MKAIAVIRTWGVLFSCVLLASCYRPLPPQASCNFVQNPENQRVSWKGNLPIKLYIHESVPTEAYAAIGRAITEFNVRAAHGREVFQVAARGVSGPLNPQKDGYSTIYWFNTWDTTMPSEQARTTIYWAGTEIFEADIRVDAANFTFNYDDSTNFNNVDLDSLMLHELGHVMGLAHTLETGSAMHPTLDNGQVRRQLGTVDMSDLSCEY